MPSSAEAPARRHAAFVQAVWGRALALQAGDVPRPVLRRMPEPGGAPPLPVPTLVLPPASDALHAAAAAHAAAHVAHGGLLLARGRLKPLQCALLALLEDARVEAAALREAPGLFALWHPWHGATPGDGSALPALLQRLQRRLFDAGYADPHPWVDKAWRLAREADGDPVALRAAASVLGHDLGQTRLGFDPRADTAGPAYRDDNRHLWQPEPAMADALPAASPDPEERTLAGMAPRLPEGRRVLQPEWDWRIGALRPAWCTVIDRDAPPGTGGPAGEPPRRWPPVASIPVHRPLRARQPEGPVFDDEALVAAAVARRRRSAGPHAPFRGRMRAAQRGMLRLLLDRSASTADAAPPDWPGAHDRLAVFTALAGGLLAAGAVDGVLAFSSAGRHAVDLRWVRRPGASPADAAARLAGLRSEGSTRLGTALRHAAGTLRPGARLLLLTDGEPHDIDVHERRYLLDDLRAAVRAAARRGIAVRCLLAAPAEPALRRCFAAGACAPLPGRHAVMAQGLAALWP